MRGKAFLFYSLLTIVMIFAVFQIGITAGSEFLSEADAANDAFSEQEANSTNYKKDIFGVS